MVSTFTKIVLLPILSVVRILIALAIFIIILGMFAPYIKDVHKYKYVHQALVVESQVNTAVKSSIPTEIVGKDFSRLIEVILLLVLLEFTRTAYDKTTFRLQSDELDDEVKKMRTAFKSKQQKEKLEELEIKMEQVRTATGKNRQELLKEFVNIKRELEKIGRDLAFLAIDVVDSTGMKVGEDPAVIEHDFNEYHDFVESKFKEHGYIKASWTPDGVMACFNNIEDAVLTAKDIINGLDYFNKHVKEMKRSFAVRCGVNGGFVYFDDAIPLEQISDRTIDIAGHMQKHAPPNKILIAKQIIEPVKSKDDFNPTERVVDGFETYEWEKK